MLRARFFPPSACMTLWNIIDHWPQISIKELEHIINHHGRRQPLLQPYERERPASGIMQENYYLAPMHRGRLSIIDYHGYFRNVLDCAGKKVSSDRAYDVDNEGWPLDDCLYFLLRDVRRIEQEHPEYLQEIVVQDEHIQEEIQMPSSTQPVPETQKPVQMPPAPSFGAALVDDKLLTVKQVMEMLEFSERTVWNKVKTGELPAGVKSGGCTRWSRNEMLAYIERLKAERK